MTRQQHQLVAQLRRSQICVATTSSMEILERAWLLRRLSDSDRAATIQSDYRVATVSVWIDRVDVAEVRRQAARSRLRDSDTRTVDVDDDAALFDGADARRSKAKSDLLDKLADSANRLEPSRIAKLWHDLSLYGATQTVSGQAPRASTTQASRALTTQASRASSAQTKQTYRATPMSMQRRTSQPTQARRMFDIPSHA
jgi:hypothetical protein